MRLLASGAIAGLPGGQQASQILFPSTLMNYAFYGARWLSFLILLGGGSRSGSCPCSPGEETAVRMPDSTPAPPSKALGRSRFQRPRMSLALPDRSTRGSWVGRQGVGSRDAAAWGAREGLWAAESPGSTACSEGGAGVPMRHLAGEVVQAMG